VAELPGREKTTLLPDPARTTSRNLNLLALATAALAVTFLLIGVGHSVILLTTGGLDRDPLAITRSQWGLVAGSIAVFLVFLALVPVRLRGNWRAHGVYIAFVVSLFAEMFGFPLSVYFLSSALGLNLLERQFMRYMYTFGMPIGSLITLFGILLIILGWREVHRAKDQLATRGIYRYLRHPQYLGLALVAAGWLVHWPTLPGLIMWPVLVFLYYRLSVKEDRYLGERFGQEYAEYASNTPRFFPGGAGPR
jgi:protein-S-isoprenylcysteine O-methyltransferase Ste14